MENKIEIEAGEIEKDFQISNFLDAIDQVFCHFNNQFTIEKKMFINALILYADYIDGEYK